MQRSANHSLPEAAEVCGARPMELTGRTSRPQTSIQLMEGSGSEFLLQMKTRFTSGREPQREVFPIPLACVIPIFSEALNATRCGNTNIFPATEAEQAATGKTFRRIFRAMAMVSPVRMIKNTRKADMIWL